MTAVLEYIELASSLSRGVVIIMQLCYHGKVDRLLGAVVKSTCKSVFLELRIHPFSELIMLNMY